MNERLSIITHKNKKICFSNYNSIKPDEYVEQIQKNTLDIIEISKKDEGQALLLNDVSDTYGSREIVAAFKASAKDVEPFAAKSAIIGVVGIQKVLLNAINSFSSLPIKAFNTKEEALEWLVKT